MVRIIHDAHPSLTLGAGLRPSKFVPDEFVAALLPPYVLRATRAYDFLFRQKVAKTSTPDMPVLLDSQLTHACPRVRIRARAAAAVNVSVAACCQPSMAGSGRAG